MKKIINKRIYDTEKATLVGEDSYSHSEDFTHYYRGLYKSTKGQFFLYEEGGPLSYMGVKISNTGRSGSENITLLDDEEAREWAEDHLSADEYLNLFPDHVEQG